MYRYEFMNLNGCCSGRYRETQMLAKYAYMTHIAAARNGIQIIRFQFDECETMA